jgi:hypothetical protein
MTPRIGFACLVGLLMSACAAQQAYDGAERPAAEVAVIEGTLPVTAGLPITARIRKIDDRVVRFGYSKVSVVDGPHHVLVDCVMQSARSTTRFGLDFETYAGHRYVLHPESAPGNRSCSGVMVEEIER